MAELGLSDALRQLLHRQLPTMDHVALLLALREEAGTAHAPDVLAARVRLDRDVAERVLRELEAAQLVRNEHGTFAFAPTPVHRATIDELAEMNRTRPVTLVRAVYDRPSRAAQSFADAFRLRRQEE